MLQNIQTASQNEEEEEPIKSQEWIKYQWNDELEQNDPSLRSRIHRLQIIELLTIRQNTEIWRRRHHRPVRTGQNLYNMTELYLLYIHVFRRFCQVLLCNRCRAELLWSRHQWFTVILAGIKAQDAAAEPTIYSSNLSLHHASWAELKPASSSSSSSSRRRRWGGIRGGESSGSEQQRSRFLQEPRVISNVPADQFSSQLPTNRSWSEPTGFIRKESERTGPEMFF